MYLELIVCILCGLRNARKINMHFYYLIIANLTIFMKVAITMCL